MAHEEAAFRHILCGQIQRYPLLAVQDLYKLVIQASFGSEHAVADPATARRRLALELDGLDDGPEEPLVDLISPDEQVARVHLRPYVASGRAPSCLLEAFLQTAQTYRGSESTFYRFWGYAECLATAGLLPFMRPTLQRFFVDMQARGFPAVRHSAAFAAAYRPAYRVVCVRFLRWLDETDVVDV
jgi:hypothetical protein